MQRNMEDTTEMIKTCQFLRMCRDTPLRTPAICSKSGRSLYHVYIYIYILNNICTDRITHVSTTSVIWRQPTINFWTGNGWGTSCCLATVLCHTLPKKEKHNTYNVRMFTHTCNFYLRFIFTGIIQWGRPDYSTNSAALRLNKCLGEVGMGERYAPVRWNQQQPTLLWQKRFMEVTLQNLWPSVERWAGRYLCV